MKKKVYAARLGVTALALTLVTTCLMGSTLARYVTEVTGSATATVAKWSFKVNNSAAATFADIDLGRTAKLESTMKLSWKQQLIPRSLMIWCFQQKRLLKQSLERVLVSS